MQAIILAAGMGKRLKELTQNNTKCMVRVNGVTLIERMLKQLDELDLKRIVLVIGYQGKKLKEYVNSLEIRTSIIYIENPIYYKTNNIYSLSLAKECMEEDDTLLLESDLIFEDSVLECLLQDKRDTLALADKYENWMDGTVMKLDSEDNILEFIGGKKMQFGGKDSYYKTVNIYKFSKNFSSHYYIPFLEAYTAALGKNEYYEQVLKILTMLDEPVIKAKKLEGQLWYEIDDIQDLDIAESIFTYSQGERVQQILNRHGGYWRYPKLLDFCYAVNPYFPPQRLIDEIKGTFEKLLMENPSGIKVNSLLMAKNFGVSPEYITGGNGIAELIKKVLDIRSGKIGVVKPAFEDNVNQDDKEKYVVFDAVSKGIQYDENLLIDYFDGKGIAILVLSNPDSLSGNLIDKNGILKLCKWADERNIILLLNESFVDFAEEEKGRTFICNDILQKYPNLIVVKDISGSYGVPGLCLGVLASARKDYIKKLKKETPMWNINSFAEFYMQIAEKYVRDYRDAIQKFRNTREEFVRHLEQLQRLKVYPTQANYILCELNGEITSAELAKCLLVQHNILISDMTDEIKNGRQYIRIAIKKTEQNRQLCEAIQMIINIKDCKLSKKVGL